MAARSFYRLSPSQTNPWGTISLVTAVAGFCALGAGGLAALVMGLFGLWRSKETHTGRGASIAGAVIGGINLLFWAVFGASILAWAGIAHQAAADGAREATAVFIGNLATDNVAAASAESSGLGDAEIKAFRDVIRPLGAVRHVTFSSVTRDHGSTVLRGAVTFEKGQLTFTARLGWNEGNGWVMQGMTLGP